MMWGRWDWVELEELVALTVNGYWGFPSVGDIFRIKTTGEALCTEWVNGRAIYCSRGAA